MGGIRALKLVKKQFFFEKKNKKLRLWGLNDVVLAMP